MIKEEQIEQLEITLELCYGRWYWDIEILGLVKPKVYGSAASEGGPFDTFKEAAANAEQEMTKLKANGELCQEGK
jgi:hypothetical protein